MVALAYVDFLESLPSNFIPVFSIVSLGLFYVELTFGKEFVDLKILTY